MKNLFSGIFITIAFFVTSLTFAQQVSPYSLTSQWRFGNRGGLNFSNGNFLDPTITTTVATNPGAENVETSTSISDKTGAIALFTNTKNVYNVTNAVIRNLVTDNTCGSSATGGGIIIPDPASPDDSYYLFIANDITLGTCQRRGINYYKFKKDGLGNVQIVGTYTNIADGNWADESMAAASDGQGNYWIITHSGLNNTFKVFKIDDTGVTGLAEQVKTPTTNNLFSGPSQSYSKISPCQNSLAWTGGNILLVYEFDRTTGLIGNLRRSKGNVGHGSGVEFSPNGEIVYHASQAVGNVGWFNWNTNSSGSIAGSSSWSMQLGPDGKIYTSPGGGSIGVINDPNSPNTTTYSSVSLGAGSTYWGLINLAWLNPEAPVIKNTISSCSVDFDYEFLNYFQSAIGVDLATVKWDFGDGNTSTDEKPSHTYGANGTYTVTLEFEDATCNHKFTATTQVTVNCGGVVTPTCNITAVISDPADNTTVTINDTDPATVSFDGSTSTFDNTSSGAHKFYWMIGGPDTTTTFLKTNATDLNDKSSLTFQHGGTLPEGTYNVYLVIRQGSCLDTTHITLIIDRPTTTPTCNLNLDANIAPVTDFILSENDPRIITFDGSGSTGFDNTSGELKQYYWINGGNPPNIANAFAITETAALTFQHGTTFPEGTYEIFLIIKQGLCADTTSITFTVGYSSTPVCTFDLVPVINAVEEVMVAENMPVTVTFDGTSSVFDPTNPSPKQYYWILGDDDITQAFSTDPKADVKFSLFGKGNPLQGGHLPQGSYDIYLVIKQGLCTDFTKFHVKVTYLYIPNLVTPNGDGKNDKFLITNTPGRFNVVIYNRWGQAVYKEDGYTDEWNMHDMSDGIYFYEVTDTKVSKTYKGWVNLIRSN